MKIDLSVLKEAGECKNIAALLWICKITEYIFWSKIYVLLEIGVNIKSNSISNPVICILDYSFHLFAEIDYYKFYSKANFVEK